MAKHYRHRVKVAAWIAAALVVTMAGMATQQRWDAQCDARYPGSRWNADVWACEWPR